LSWVHSAFEKPARCSFITCDSSTGTWSAAPRPRA
jgi:hypothetical protein